MVFTPPAWIPACPDIPDSVSTWHVFADEKYGRYPIGESRDPYTCGLTGRSYSAADVRARTDALARALSHRLGVRPNQGTEWDKVVCIYSLNTIDYIPACHAVHRLSGIVTPANAAYSAAEVRHQLQSTGAKAIITCVRLLPNALRAAAAHGIPNERVFLFEMAGDPADKPPFPTIDQLISEGAALPELEPLRWSRGQARRQVAFLSHSSGTSGPPKTVMVSHYNVITNIVQYATFNSVARKKEGIETEVVLGLVPFSHACGLVVVTQSCTYRGDQVIVLPEFGLDPHLAAIQRFSVRYLFLFPPIVADLVRNPEKCAAFDLSSVRMIYTAGVPLDRDVADLARKMLPHARIGQGYGLSETSTFVTSSTELDLTDGTAGCLLPGFRAKLVDADGREVTALDTPGELLIQGPSVVLGYLKSPRQSAEIFSWADDGQWLRTEDLAAVYRSPAGNEHFIILGRVKELIKVGAYRVSPLELEAHLLTHPSVADCAVIQVPDPVVGEVPRAYVVLDLGRGAAAGRLESGSESESEIARDLCQYVEEHKPWYKWLRGGVVFVEEIPRAAGGKILRRVLRERERRERRATGARLS